MYVRIPLSNDCLLRFYFTRLNWGKVDNKNASQNQINVTKHKHNDEIIEISSLFFTVIIKPV